MLILCTQATYFLYPTIAASFFAVIYYLLIYLNSCHCTKIFVRAIFTPQPRAASNCSISSCASIPILFLCAFRGSSVLFILYSSQRLFYLSFISLTLLLFFSVCVYSFQFFASCPS